MNDPHRYDYGIDLERETAAAKVVRMVGLEKRVLEIGAGPGSITQILKEQAACRVTAIERDETAIGALTAFCERVHRLDLNEAGWVSQACAQTPFDVVVAADVLEHLVDPWLALARMREALNPEGYVVVSLPHVGHSAVIGALFSGSFEYGDTGLLDRTHLRFFCVQNMQALFVRAGFKIVAAEFVIRKPQDTEFADRWRRLPASLKEQLAHNPYGDVFQVVIKAVPHAAPGTALDLAKLPIPLNAPWVPGASLKTRVYLIVRTLIPRAQRQVIERWLRRHGWLR